VSLDDAVVFVAVGEKASFSATARQLGMTRVAVTRAIAKLERALGTRLLLRTTRRVSLTTVGRKLHEQIKDPVVSLSGAIRELSKRATLDA
jgi:DNA-binding transcriptional LysR family regulator